jgi:hypothetical protein
VMPFLNIRQSRSKRYVTSRRKEELIPPHARHGRRPQNLRLRTDGPSTSAAPQTLIGVQHNHEKVDIPENLDDGAAPITGIEEGDPEPVSDIKAKELRREPGPHASDQVTGDSRESGPSHRYHGI